MTLTYRKLPRSKMESTKNRVPSDLMMDELKEKLRISEESRKSLQQKFDVMMQTYRIKEQARYSALKRRYGAFLEEDQRRQQRNENLLQMLERIDMRTSNLAARTERLALLRKHYEQYLGRIYPTWRAASHPRVSTPAPSHKIPDDHDEDVSGYGTHTGSSMYFRESKRYAEHSRMPQTSTPKQNVPSYKVENILPDKYKLPRVDFDMPSITVRRPPEEDGYRTLSPRFELRDEAREISRPTSRQEFSLRDARNQQEFSTRDSRNQPEYSNRDSRNQPEFSPRDTRRMPEFPSRERTPRNQFSLAQPEFELDQNTSGDLLNMSLSEDGVSSLSRSDMDAELNRRHHWETLKQAYLNRSQHLPRDGERGSALDEDPRATDWAHQTARSHDAYDADPIRNEELSQQPPTEQDSPGRESFRDKIRRLKIMVQENKELERLADANEPTETSWDRNNDSNVDKNGQLEHGERRRRSVYDTQSSLEPQGNEGDVQSWQDQRMRPDVETNVRTEENLKEEKPTAEHIRTRRMSVLQPQQSVQKQSSIEESNTEYQRRKSQQWTDDNTIPPPEERRGSRDEKPLSDVSMRPNNIQNERRNSQLENQPRGELQRRQSGRQEDMPDFARRNEEREYYQGPPQDIGTKRDSVSYNNEQQYENPSTNPNLDARYTDGQHPNEQVESRYNEEHQRRPIPEEQFKHTNERRDSMKQDSSRVISNPGPDNYNYEGKEYENYSTHDAKDAPQISNNNDGERQYYEDNSGYTDNREQQPGQGSYNEAPQNYNYEYNQDNNAQYGYGQEYTNNQMDNTYSQQQDQGEYGQDQKDYNQPTSHDQQVREDYNQDQRDYNQSNLQQQQIQGDYSQDQGDYNQPNPQQQQSQGDYSQDQGDYNQPNPQQQQSQGDYSQDQGDYNQPNPQQQQSQGNYSQDQREYSQPNEQEYYQDNAYYAQQGSNNAQYDQQYSEQGYTQQEQYDGNSMGWPQDPSQQQTSQPDQHMQSEQYGYYEQQNQGEYQQDPQSQPGNEYNYQPQDTNQPYDSSGAQRPPDPTIRDDQQSKYAAEGAGGYGHDASEDSTQNTDMSQHMVMGQGQQSPSQQSVDRYRAMLGVDPNSEPSYSEIDEIEAEMAAVVAGGTREAEPKSTESLQVTTVAPRQNESKSGDAKPSQVHEDSSDFDYSTGP